MMFQIQCKTIIITQWKIHMYKFIGLRVLNQFKLNITAYFIFWLLVDGVDVSGPLSQVESGIKVQLQKQYLH